MAVPDDFRTARFVSTNLLVNDSISVVIFQSQMCNEFFSTQVAQGVL